MGLSFRTISVNDGLSQNLISAILQDHYGFMWFGTKDGLNMFDGYSFTVFRNDPFKRETLGSNYITALHEDHSGNLWIGTMESGLYLFHRENKAFLRFGQSDGDHLGMHHPHIHSITSDQQGNLWVATSFGGLYKLAFQEVGLTPDPKTTTITSYNDKDFPEEGAWINILLADRDGNVWMGTQAGIYVFDPSDDPPAFVSLPFERTPSMDKSKMAGAGFLLEDRDGELWMGNMLGWFLLDKNRQVFLPFPSGEERSFEGAVHAASLFYHGDNKEIWISTGRSLVIMQPSSGLSRELNYDDYQKHGLQKGQYVNLYADKGGAMWIGSNGYGLSLFDPEAIKFSYPDEQALGHNEGVRSTRDLSVRAFYQQPGAPGILWVGANQGLFRVNRKASTMEAIEYFQSYPRGERVIFSIRADQEGILWVGSSQGLFRLNPSTGEYRMFPTGLVDEMGRTEPRVSFVHPGKDAIWLLTPVTIARFDQATERFEHFRYSDELLDEYREATFPFLMPDEKGNFWIGAKNGLHYFEPSDASFTSFSNDPLDQGSLGFNHVLAMVRDPLEPDRYLWLGTGGGGLNRFDMQTRHFKHLTSENGLANDMVYGLLADENGHLWMSTNRGLSRYNILENTFTNYSVSEGLQSNEFNSGAFFEAPDGQLFFGGIQGYNSFYPSLIRPKAFNAPVVFTRFRVLTSPEDPNPPAPILNFTGHSRVVLSPKQNSFSVDFASLDFAHTYKNHFAYSLTTQGEKWIALGNQRSMTFTGLKPGHYTLRIRGTNNDGVWSTSEAVATITIPVPWWGKPWMMFVYILLLVVAMVVLRRYEIARIRMRNSIRYAQMETSKLKELDHLKSRFFANISHEFRTPLTLIKGPVEQMLEKTPDPKQRKVLTILQTNADRLMQLINQLLDLSRLESGEFHVNARPGDISGFLRGLVMSFASLAETKNIALHFEEFPGIQESDFQKQFCFDRDVIEKIINNLLSNALKFTPENGRVTVEACIAVDRSGAVFLEVVIADTGIGIPEDKLPFIYDRFYQVDPSNKREQEGSGVGLAYVKELVKVHKGSIMVKSRAGSGTTFSIRFPCGTEHFPMPESGELSTLQTSNDSFPQPGSRKQARGFEPGQQAGPLSQESKEKPLVLVVEDHGDVRQYIVDCLEGEYRTSEAPDAAEGLALATFSIPDLIISDVMMPKMDGYEFCGRIKTDEKTSHIPVILLTALAGEQDRISGLETGADDYLAKPFNPKELKARVKNLIENRKVLRQKFRENSIIRTNEITVTSRDKAFMQKVMAIVEQNIANEKFSVDELGRELGMSQSQLHRKLKAVINQSPVQLIRSVRMHRAMELLEKDAGNISEVAYLTGYEDPGYFSRTFKAFFGTLPSRVRKK